MKISTKGMISKLEIDRTSRFTDLCGRCCYLFEGEIIVSANKNSMIRMPFDIDTKWELIQEPTDIKTAWQANKNGKTIKHVFDDNYIGPEYLQKEMLYLPFWARFVSIARILNGKWYIEE